MFLPIFIKNAILTVPILKGTPHFYFSLPTEKFLRGQGEKIPEQRREIIKVFVGNKKGASWTYDTPSWTMKQASFANEACFIFYAYECIPVRK